MHYEVSVDVAAPPERAWAILADVERWPEWTASTRSVRRLEEGPLQAGSTARVEQPGLAPMTYRVTGFTPGADFTWVARRAGIQVVAAHRLAPRGDGACAVTLTLDMRGPLAPLLGRLLGDRARRYVGMEAEGLKRRAEA